MHIFLYNTLTKKVMQFQPIEENTVRMYSCGPTVYNYAHIGNMRAFLFADLLQRVLRVVGGYKVNWVMNITNIDDKTIRDSALGSAAWKPEMGEQTDNPKTNLEMFTLYYQDAFFEDITKLGINLKHFLNIPRATDYIPQMQELIKKIVDNGYGYVSDGSVYFNVSEWRKKDIYGKLHKIDFENFKSGARIDNDQYDKEQASDFALWKAKKPGEPYWKFDFNGMRCDGRPGWHIECSVMEKELLGLPFDIHTGGVDLKFPHHEDEIAQSKAGYGVEPTAYWCHNEFLEVEGEKMSKSLGNFFTLRDLIEKGLDPLDIRYFMLSAHYGSVLNFTFEGIEAARKARQRIQEYIYSLHEEKENSKHSSIDIDDFRKTVFGELSNDLHTPKALAAVFSFINNNEPAKLNASASKKLIHFFKELNMIFDCWKIEPKKEEELIIPDEIIKMAEQRLELKKQKKFSEADLLREKITSAGYNIKDSKDSFVLEKSK